MPDRPRTLVLPLVVVLALAGLAALSRAHSRTAAASAGRVEGRISAAERAATFTFAPDVAPYDRAAILGAVGRARPEARRLIDVVDGLVTIDVGLTPSHSVGITTSEGDRFRIVLNLGAAARASGRRGIDRLVLHEIGHVVDFALVPDNLVDRLDAEVPTRYGCDDGVTGACANPREVFAESFAKWATGDIGINLDLGYAIPPPGDLAAWGAPLASLGR
jgi:hypothetical protein